MNPADPVKSYISKPHIPVQHGIKGMIASDMSCDKCGQFNPRSSFVSGASVGMKRFKRICPLCVEKKHGNNRP